MRLVILDSSPLWLMTRPPGDVQGDRCRAWAAAAVGAGSRVVIPGIADYETRRELLRRGATAALTRLNDLRANLPPAPLTGAVFDLAAQLWADVRRVGLPTAPPAALDADCILAAQALLAGGPGDTVTVATANVGHLGRFPGLDVREWWTVR